MQAQSKKKKIRLSPYMIIVLSFLGVIVVGTLLLLIPAATNNNTSLSLVDAFFLSTSSVTLTGFTPVFDLGTTLSTYGKIVVASLIQIGGISIISITVFIMILLDVKIGLNNRVLVKESMNQNSLSGMVRLIKIIIITSFAVELAGTIVNLIVFIPHYNSIGKAIGVSVFHSISAFNNAGTDILGLSNQLVLFQDNVLLNINTILLIILGGLGFVVIYDVFTKRSFRKLSLHSKIVLKMTIILIVFGTLSLKLAQSTTEHNITWLQALFHSVSARTAGFNTIDTLHFSSISLLILMVLMFIGAGSSSSAGGIKVTTTYTLLKTFQGYVNGKPAITYGRKISEQTKTKAFVLLFIAIAIILILTIFLMALEAFDLERALFLSVSTFSTAGLSLNLTQSLQITSKVMLMIVMFIGRIGVFTILYIWKGNTNLESSHVRYVEEKLMIG